MRQIKNKFKTYRANIPNGQGQKTENKQKKFRISGKRIVLTYSQVDPYMQPTYLVGLLERSLHLTRLYFVIAKEQHHIPDSTDFDKNSSICH